MQDLRSEIAALESRRPDPEENPGGFRIVNEQIAKLIDCDRAYRNPRKRAIV